MGKASKWIRNFLMGKREEKNKKTYPSILQETHYLSTPAPTLPANTPKIRRRWSFKRSTSNKTSTHKSTKSLDSILMPKQTLQEYQIQQSHAAATKIQAIYRSYLARRALRALRGLVKLQALARGHLVRKQMTCVLRSMHAVMAIQVRARIHRVQMVAEEPPLTAARKSYKESLASNSQLRKEISENIASESIHQIRGGLRSRSGRVDHTLAERAEYSSSKFNPGRLSVSRGEYQPKMCPSPSTFSFTNSSSTTCDVQLEDFSLKMAPQNSKGYTAWSEIKQPFTNYFSQGPDYVTSNSYLIPNYMTNTKSSDAKSRSHSEPKQRPKLGKRQKSRRSSSMDGKNDKENQYHWLTKLYQSSNFMNDGDCDSSTSAMNSISNHRKSFIPFEIPVSL